MSLRRRATALLGLTVAVAGVQSFALPAAHANPAGTGLVISEVYGGGGNSGATLTNDFIELYNPTSAPISVADMSVQYRSATSVSDAEVTPLTGSVPARGYYLIQEATGAGGTTALPAPDAVGSSTIGATSFTVFLARGTAPLNPPAGSVTTNTNVVDLLGVKSNTFETTTTAATTNTTSASRNTSGSDTDVNSADFTIGAPAPANSGGANPPGATCPAAPQTIAQIQGDNTDTSPCVNAPVTTTGVVTAAYPVGGLAGFYLQTGGAPSTPDASDGIFVYAGSNLTAEQYPSIGATVTVSGTAREYFGLTEINLAGAAGVTTATTTQPPVVAKTVIPGTDCAAPGTDCLTGAALDAAREKSEGELYAPSGDYTVTDSYDGSPSPSTSSSFFGEIALAANSKVPLIQPTEIIDAQDTAGIAARTAYNNAHRVILDDGSSTNYSTTTGQPFPWLTKTHTVRAGAAVTFPQPVVLTYANSSWKIEPSGGQVVGAPTGKVSFAQDRPAAPGDVGGDVRLGTFNVLNYFPTTGQEYVDAGLGTCTYYNDRAGAPVTTRDCGATGPRGAANVENFKRQEAKIVTAINTLGASIVSLEEIENSVKFGKDRDYAVGVLVAALNAQAGAGTWAFAPSPAAADLPPTSAQDVIRTAFIYKPADVALVGPSKVLVGSSAFTNARQPLAQGFKAVGAPTSDAFAVVVNHFKSKGSGGTGDNANTGQGFYNGDRTRQAMALKTFAGDFSTALGGSGAVFLAGDFNAYTQEDPVQVLTNATDGGYTELESTTNPGEETYNFGGLSGSLDHVFANPAAKKLVTGVDIWNINADESVYYEYSRYNYNATDLYDAGPYRASDHNPEVVGLDLPAVPSPTVKLNLLGFNDFHGRIDANTTKWATTIEQLRAAGGADNTLLLGSGDSIGASLFPSASADDNPTLDVLNAIGVNSSAVGNHEFDKGFEDLRGRVQDRADFSYLGANVYRAGTQTPVLDEYDLFQVGGLSVAVIGAVTQDTPSVVSPAGIQGLEFGDPVAAVNRVAARLTDGIKTRNNDEADVIVAQYHEGAPLGDTSAPPATLQSNLDDSATFRAIATQTAPEVDAIFTGHTHQKYAYSAPVVGGDLANRPIVQTGQYGEFIGQIDLTVDRATGKVTQSTQRNVARAAAEDLTFPRVAEVKRITDAAIAAAATVGNRPVASITADITTAFTGGSFVGGTYTGGARGNRAAESTIGDLVATAYVDGLPADLGQADLGIVNPGGLRDELYFAGNTANNPANTDGVVTFAEANAVLPFANNIVLVDLTGAQLQSVLEQQWSTNDAGVATGAYLQLGLSENVNVTADASKPLGSRITSVSIDGVPLDPSRTYTVSTVSFLATGGDNFRAFRQGSSRDTGLLDRDLWIGYLGDSSPITPDFDRQQVFETGKPDTITAGVRTRFTLGTDAVAPTVPDTGETLDLTSLGSPANTTVVATIAGATVGTFPVTNGTASIDLTVPTTFAQAGNVVFTAQPSGTVVTVPFVPGATLPSRQVETAIEAKLKPGKITVDKTRARLDIDVAAVNGAKGADIEGQITILVEGRQMQTVTLRKGKAKVDLGTFGEVGVTEVLVSYLGNDEFAPSEQTVEIEVVRR